MTSLKPTAKRPAFTLVELIIAMILLSAVTAVMLPMIISLSAQRHAAEQRQYALILAENQLDELLAHPWAEVTTETLATASQRLKSSAAAPDFKLTELEQQVTVTDQPEASAKLITLQLRWKNRQGDFTTPIQLSAWKFAATEVKP